MLNLQPLVGRTALVTGCSRRIGIGFAIANRLATLGADLVVHGHMPYDIEQSWGSDPAGMPAIVDELSQHGGRVKSLAADFLQPEAPQQLMVRANETLGHVDILVANHAYSTTGALEEMTAEQIDKHLLINVRATLLLTQAFAAQHDSRPGGRVVYLTSGQHLGPMPSELAYIASKGALHQLTLSLSAHLVRRGITVNTVNPGATDTGWASPALYQEILALSPQGRWGQPDDAARLIAWLCTDDAQWITGQVINSTGGGP